MSQVNILKDALTRISNLVRSWEGRERVPYENIETIAQHALKDHAAATYQPKVKPINLDADEDEALAAGDGLSE